MLLRKRFVGENKQNRQNLFYLKGAYIFRIYRVLLASLYLNFQSQYKRPTNRSSIILYNPLPSARRVKGIIATSRRKLIGQQLGGLASYLYKRFFTKRTFIKNAWSVFELITSSDCRIKSNQVMCLATSISYYT